MTTKNSVIFLDRDGVINVRRDDHIKSVDEFVFLPDSIRALSKLYKQGFKLIIITNQSVVNRGFITEAQLNKIHQHMINTLSKHECKIEKIYYCPHRPDENCNCRKPRPGLLLQAIKEFKPDLSASWLIGDCDSDIEAAKEVGLKSIKINTNSSLMQTIEVLEKSIK